ncbi:MAG: SDR family oxidoreductase [Synergistaceae bacterium]|jgi:NAD(P)-dependent dehydrogenase (short-subunit alcohol dehydrogenase family)|nr:SDR family oxidoreductase [Synergistaceae bacterium]
MRTISELSSLSGRVALITGAGGHIGSVIGDALAELCADLILLDREERQCRESEARISGLWGVSTSSIIADLEHIGDFNIVDEVMKIFGRLDILVNCAAFVGTDKLEGWNAPFAEQGVETWRRAVEVNLTAPFILSQALAPMLSESGHGSIINLSSIYGVCAPDLSIYEGTDMHNPAAYAASKAGLLQLTRWMSTVLAPRVRVNAITPGGVEREQPEGFIGRYAARTPMGRMAREEDIKGAAAYLASDLSGYVTGQNIVIDGGWSVW